MTINGSISVKYDYISFMGGHSYEGHPGNALYPENFRYTLFLINKIKRK